MNACSIARLGHITLATDRGVKHISHDYSGGVIHPSGFRVRFEITGDISKLDISQKDNTINVAYGDLNLVFKYSYAVYNGETLPFELIRYNDSLCFDLVMHKGPSKKIVLEKLKETITSWAFCISKNKDCSLDVHNETKSKKLVSTMLTDSGIELQLESLNKPDTFVNIHSNNTQKIAGTVLEKFVLNNNINNRQLSFITHNNNNNNKDYHIYDFLINKTDDINQCLQSLTKRHEEDFVTAAKHVFTLVKQNNISLNIAKRIATQILIQIYDYYKNVNIQFESIISEQTVTTQLYISLSTSIEDIESHTVSALKLLHTHHIKLHKPATDSLLLNKIISLINDNFSDPQLSLDYISKEIGTSTFAISKIFQNKLKIRYIDYVTSVRIDYAKQLLEQTNLSLTEISSKVGYAEQSTFFRAFKKVTKETPAQYKRRIKQ